MVVLTKKTLIDYYTVEDRSKTAIEEWYEIVKEADWANFNEMRRIFGSADAVGNDRYVFNIGGNRYRIVAMIHFKTRTMYIRFVGTHSEYDKTDCKNI